MKKETIKRIRDFTIDRDWDQFHSPANLAKSISIEANELLECFQWSDDNYDIEHVKEELADVSATVQVATDCFKHGLDFLSEGINKVSGSADADKLASLYDQMADIRYEVEKISKGWGF